MVAFCHAKIFNMFYLKTLMPINRYFGGVVMNCFVMTDNPNVCLLLDWSEH